MIARRESGSFAPAEPLAVGERKRGAFTLVELLVVLVILGVLVMLLGVNAGEMIRRVNTAVCASRLHDLGTAYHTRAADLGPAVAGQPISCQYGESEVPAGGHTNDPWPVALWRYVDEQTTSYVCPEGSRTATYTFGGSGPPTEVADTVDLTEYAFLSTGATPYDPSTAPGEIGTGTDEESNALPGGGYDQWCAVPFDPYCYRISIRPYVNGQPAELVQDVPDGYDWTTAEVFELAFEARFDYDWNDFVLRFTRRDDGSTFVECVFFESAGYYNVLDGQAGPAALPEFLNTCTTSAPAPTQRSVVLWPRGQQGGGADGGDSGETRDVDVSYGMNAVAHKLGGASDKVLMVEYHKNVADVVGAAAADDWAEQVAPRHRDRCHVLFADGTVSLLAPDAIDPANAAHHDRYWKSDDIPPMAP